ncbi:MAG: type II toxin-antitoxin system RelE/ParE family toxin [Clostridia bacterium]|jgi:plasmid stabilization system protein ParE
MKNNIYTLKLTLKAEKDLDDIYQYITTKLFAGIAAQNLLIRIENEIMLVKEFPHSCSLVRDNALRKKGYRKLIVDNFIAFYLINEDKKQVIIMRVLYGASNYTNIL